jgi:Ohr subfamily peroxiredoxin
MPDKIVYSTSVTAYGDGRGGTVTSDDDVLDLDLAVPAAMGGPGGAKTNPEQLFAAGYAACFHSALKITAGKVGVDTTGSTVTAVVGIGPDGPAYALAVELTVALPAAGDAESARKAVDLAHQVCPYSRATRGNVDVRLTLS